MVPDTDSRQRAGLDDFIEAFEEAQARGLAADLADFLPREGHPLYPQVLRELVRVDLEYGWARGRPPLRGEYRRRFPALFAAPAAARDIAFEEYRLRHQAGERPAPGDYRRDFDVNTAGWPTFPAGP